MAEEVVETSSYTKHHRAWYEKHKADIVEKRRAYAAKYRAEHKDRIKAYKESHREQIRAADRARYHRRKATPAADAPSEESE